MRLLIATRNRNKFREIEAILGGAGLELLCAADQPGLPEVDETGATFDDNARLKAAALARASGMWTLADDSGLEVAALNNAPGVHSARFAGIPSDDRANNAKLLALMDKIADRRARFRCVIALANPDGEIRTVEGCCEGSLLRTPRGTAGFGYDPLFVPDGLTETFAELQEAVKNRISHRARALAKARREWRGLLAGGGNA